jgi:diguanylate cyclase (GGDEF)-like protein/PAS domain S-box-containing protein
LKIKVLFVTLFLILVSVALSVSAIYRQQSIDNELSLSIQNLKTNYDIVLHDYEVAAAAIHYSTFQYPGIKQKLAEALEADSRRKDEIRRELYQELSKEFLATKLLGVKLILFTHPDNTVFLRMHKPDIYGDDISDVRFSLAAVNQSHQSMKGFEQGKISHAFRYIYPIFDDIGRYIGNMDISFSSERLQQTLDQVHDLHTHFLVSKDVIDSRIWSVTNVTAAYRPSVEHANYLIYKPDEHRPENHHLDKVLVKPVLQQNAEAIRENMDDSRQFAVYGSYKDQHIAIAFLPIESIIHDHKAEAYLVSYTVHPAITKILNKFMMINLGNITIIGLTLLVIYMLLIKRQALKREHEYQVRLMNLASDGVFILDLEGKLIDCSASAVKMLGYSPEAMKGMHVYDWDVAHSKEEAVLHIRNTPTEPMTFETLHKRKDGTVFDASITAAKINIDGKELVYASVRDITAHKKQEQQVREQLQKFIDTQNSIVVLSDGDHIKFANKMFYEFFGYEALSSFEQTYQCICHHFIEDEIFFHLGKVTPDDANWIESLRKLSGRQRVVSMEDIEGVQHAFSVSINPYDEENYVVSFTDISDTMLEKLQLTKQATVDDLTGAYNRLYFNQVIQQLLHRHYRNSFGTGVIFFDIDHFKTINDTYGHDVGDEVLKTIVSVVKRYSRDDDKLIRWGGEEFVIIMATEAVEGIRKNAEHIRSIIEHTVFNPLDQRVTCSFGCAMHDERDDIMQTIKRADEALYRAKEGGRNRVEVSN